MIPLLLQAAAAIAATEADFYAVDYLVPPQGERVEVGGLDFLPDGRLVCSTRRGQVWMVTNPLAKDPKDAKFSLFCEGLHEGLGLEVVDGQIYVLQRGELSRLVDEDSDGVCDRVDTVAQGWAYSGHYHEFAFGLPRDAAGNFYIGLNVSFGDPEWWHGRSTVPDRGWILRIRPDGALERVASGARSPCGLGRNLAGDIFYTDNQGDWMPACPIFHVEDGAFFGHPASLNWTDEYKASGRTASDTVAPDHPRVNPALWLPYDWSRSTGNLVPDDTGGKFGPFAGQLFVAEMTNGYVLRAGMQKVGGRWQGWVVPFRHKVGSNVRLRFAPDGTLFCGFTDRGWGGQAPGDGIGRVRWTGKTPFEIADVRAVAGGFEIEFTKPIAPASVAALQHADVKQYDYNYWWEYGSPPQHVTQRTVASVGLDRSQRKLGILVACIDEGMVARVKLDALRSIDGEPLLHDELAYTLNQIPGQPASGVLIAKTVEQPEAKERGDEGVLYLTRGDVLDGWTPGPDSRAWSAGEVALEKDDPTRVRIDPEREPDGWSGPTLLSAAGEGEARIASRIGHGDADLHVDFFLAKGAEARVLLMGDHGVLLRDGEGCGSLEPASSAAPPWPGAKPIFNAYRGHGKWHGMDVKFFRARDGKPAKIARILVDDVLLHEEVELPRPSDGAGHVEPEGESGRIVLSVTKGQAAFRGVRLRSREPRVDAAGWRPIFDGASLEGWKISDDGQWKVEDGEIVGSGPASHLFSPRGDYRDFELRAKVKINGGGNSGMYVRAAFGAGWPKGYEAQVNSTHEDPVKTGSLYGLSPVKTQLVPQDAWFVQQITCRDEPHGTRITIRVNGVVVTDFVDSERRFASGHVALQQHHDGSVVRYKDVEVRELSGAALSPSQAR